MLATLSMVGRLPVSGHRWLPAVLRMDELKKNFDYRVANAPIVVAKDAKGNEVKVKESVSVKNSTWQGENSIYCPYPTTEVEKNPNLKR